MGDIDEILSDMQYVIAIEKSKSQPEAIVYKKLALPDSSVRCIMEKYLEKSGNLTFERIFNQKLGYMLFKQFCKCDPQVPAICQQFIALYDAIMEFKKLDAAQARLEKAGEIYDHMIMPQILNHAHHFSNASLQHVQRYLIKSHVPVNLFELYETEIQDHLNGEIFAKFLTSEKFTRYCQWKNYELNLNLSKEQFVIFRILGRGGFGLVYGCVKQDTGKMYAMKCLDKKRIKQRLNSETLALNERVMLSLVSSGEECPFIVCMTYAFQTPDQLVLIMNLMIGGDLSYHLKQRKNHFNEKEMKFYAAEILLGMQHLYNRSIVHRDLKPANVLLDDNGHIRISDLGLACDYSQKKPQAGVGTPGFVAPEVVAKQPYDSSADFFSYGCTLFALLSGVTPFYEQYAKHKEKKKQKKEKGFDDKMNYELPDDIYPQDISVECRNLLATLVAVKVPNRLGCKTSNGPEEVKKHPFFADIDWQQVFAKGLVPPVVPQRGDVNAENTFEIGRFDDKDLKNVVLTKEDQKWYDNFNIVISERWQEELTDNIFEGANKEADIEEEKKKLKHKIFNEADEKDTDILLYGILKKLGGPFSTAWQTRYAKLYVNRLELYPDSGSGKPELIFLDKASVMTELQEVKNEKCVVLILNEAHKHQHGDQEVRLVLSSKDEICLKEWHNSMITAWKLSHDLLQRMTEKAVKIYGINRDPILSEGMIEKIGKIFDSGFMGLFLPPKASEETNIQ